jgi:hypothetical protein
LLAVIQTGITRPAVCQDESSPTRHSVHLLVPFEGEYFAAPLLCAIERSKDIVLGSARCIDVTRAANAFMDHAFKEVTIVNAPEHVMGGLRGLSSPFGDVIYVDLSNVLKRGDATISLSAVKRTSILHECAHTFSRSGLPRSVDWLPDAFVSGGFVEWTLHDSSSFSVPLAIPGEQVSMIQVEAGHALDFALNIAHAGEQPSRHRFAALVRTRPETALTILCPFSLTFQTRRSSR